MGKGDDPNCAAAVTGGTAGAMTAAALVDPRPAGPEQIDALLDLKGRVVADAYKDLDQDALARWSERFNSRSYFEERVGSDHTTFYTLGPADNPYAMGALKVRDGDAYIGDLYCAATGQGHGSEMMDFLLGQAHEQGLQEAVADVFSTNRGAKRFLQREGFVPDGGYVEQSLGVWVHRMRRPVLMDRAYELSMCSPRALMGMTDKELRREAMQLRSKHALARDRAEKRALLQERFSERPAVMLDGMAEAIWHQVRDIDFAEDGGSVILKGGHPGGEDGAMWVQVNADGSREQVEPDPDYFWI